MNDRWSRTEKMTLAAVLVALVGAIAALIVVPEVRHALGLDATRKREITTTEPSSGVPVRVRTPRTGEMSSIAPVNASQAGDSPKNAAAEPEPFEDDKSKILFLSDRQTVGQHRMQIYTIRPDGAHLSRLTTDDADDGPAAWSPDGRTIAFISARGTDSELYVMDADGSNQRRLSTGGRVTTLGSFSPDGKKIAFTSDRDGNNEIYVMNLDHGHPVRLTFDPADDQMPLFSPDGMRIAFMSKRGGDDFDIYVADADGANPQRLTRNQGRAVPSAWSPDGSMIAYHAGGNGTLQVFVMKADGTDRTQLTAATNDNSEATWSPDGKRLAFLSTRQHPWINNIWMMNADGSGQHPIETEYAQHYFVRWSPLVLRTKQHGT